MTSDACSSGSCTKTGLPECSRSPSSTASLSRAVLQVVSLVLQIFTDFHPGYDDGRNRARAAPLSVLVLITYGSDRIHRLLDVLGRLERSLGNTELVCPGRKSSILGTCLITTDDAMRATTSDFGSV